MSSENKLNQLIEDTVSSELKKEKDFYVNKRKGSGDFKENQYEEINMELGDLKKAFDNMQANYTQMKEYNSKTLEDFEGLSKKMHM